MALPERTPALEDLIGEPLRALRQAQAALGEQVLAHVAQACEPGAAGALRPRELALRLPAAGGPSPGAVRAPLLALCPVPELALARASVRFSVELQRLSQPAGAPPRLHGQVAGPHPRASDPHPRLRLELRLRAQPPTEGRQRLQGRLARSALTR